MIINFDKLKKEFNYLVKNMEKSFYLQEPIKKIVSKFFYKDGDSEFDDNELICKFLCKQLYNYVELDAIEGCLIGGAIGDAFGAPVEFFEDYTIFELYGESGITQLELCKGVALISDDTQMTLFTADGLIKAEKRVAKPTADDYVQCVYEAYLDWLYTQDPTFKLDENTQHSELLKIKELHCKRAPGVTCLNALYSGYCGSFENKLNDSKGCGGIMRVAPVALYLSQVQGLKLKDIAMIGARVAAITHSHELGYIPAAFLTSLICSVLKGETLIEGVRHAKNTVKTLFPDSVECDYCLNLVDKAIGLALQNDDEGEIDDLDAIHLLGEGWVAEETLAIAIYCALKYSETIYDFEKAMIAAVNHSGDSDSTAAVTGNILGAYWGLRRLPKKMVEVIELKDVILDLSKKMHINKLNTEI